MPSLTLRFLGTGMVSVWVANVTERRKDIPHQRPAWREEKRGQAEGWVISEYRQWGSLVILLRLRTWCSVVPHAARPECERSRHEGSGAPTCLACSSGLNTIPELSPHSNYGPPPQLPSPLSPCPPMTLPIASSTLSTSCPQSANLAPATMEPVNGSRSAASCSLRVRTTKEALFLVIELAYRSTI